MKEFLVNHNDKWTLHLLDADTEENSFRVAVPSGAEYMTMPNRYFWKDGDVDHAWCDDGKEWNNNEGESMQEYLRGSCSASIAWQRHTQPEELPFIDDEPRSVEQINKAAMHHIVERGKTYDSQTGERSAHKTALAFNAVTGHNITEAEVFLLLQILKDVRQWSKCDYHQDSAEDSISYAVLKAEALEREIKPLHHF